MRVEKWRWPIEPAQPPAEQHRGAAGKNCERRRGRRLRNGPGGGPFIDAAGRRAEHRFAGAAISVMVHDGMNDADDREPRTRRIRDRSAAARAVPAKDPAMAQADASQRVCSCGQPDAPGRHLEDVRSAGRVEDIVPFEEPRERLAVLAIADQAQPRGRPDFTGDAAQAATAAPKRQV